MEVITKFCLIVFGIIVSLQLLCSISTCRPITNNYNSDSYMKVNNYNSDSYIKVNNHIASSRINNHGIEEHGDSLDNHNCHDHENTTTNNHLDTRNTTMSLVPALFVFGDSTVDVGNNNHLITISRSNFPPYGRDLPDKKPSGRFCNGKLVIDYIASMVGLQPTVVANLDIDHGMKRNHEVHNIPLQLQVSFASSSSGFYDSTALHFNALPLRKQLDHFKEYRQALMVERGLEDGMEIIGKAIFVISSGTNDYINNYYLNPYLRSKYSLHQFQNLLLDRCAQFIKEIYELGARRIGVVSLPPFGCLPAIRTIYRKGDENGCVEHLNQHANAFNQELRSTIFPFLKNNLLGLKLAYMDSHSVLLDVVDNPTTYGFKQAQKACCGSGKLEVGIFCNKLSIGTCEDATAYAFWDSFHPTDQMNKILATKLMEQVWRDFEMDEPYVIHHYKHASIQDLLKENTPKVITLRKWRWKIFLLGTVLYIVHMIKQFFPKMIDLGI